MTLAQHRPDTRRTTASYGGRMSLLLAVAFTLSATHTTYGYLTGLGDPRFTVTTPVAWAFYALGFATAAAARSRRRWLQAAVVGCLGVMIAVAVFYYPTTFVPRQQTTFGWFENDVYTGLLMVAAYLGVQQLRGVTLSPR